MAKVCLVRHFETLSNEKGLFGDSPRPLDDMPSERGKKQVAALRQRLESSAYVFNCIFFGSSLRQRETARHCINGLKAQSFRIEKSLPGLDEKRVGEWSGKSKLEIDQKLLAKWRAGEFVPPGGESESDLRNRVLSCWYNFIEPVLQQNENLLVVTSGNPIRIIIGKILEIPASQQQFIDIDNCSITIVRKADTGRVYVATLNDVSHLKDVGVTALPGAG